jgi:hypothetical protein
MKARARICSLLLLSLAACGDSDSKTETPSPDVGADTADAARDTNDTADTAEDVADAPDAPDAQDAADVPEDTTPPPPHVDPTPEQDGVDPDGAEVPAMVPAGEVRVGVVGRAAGGFFGVESTCKAGDFVLANAHARYCVEGTTTTTHLYFDGGRLIDAVPAGSDAGDRLHVMSTFAAVQAGAARSVEVIRDGTADALAVLRVSGPLEPIMYFAGAIGPALFAPKPIDMVTEYRLRGDSAVLEMVTFYVSRGTATNISPGAGDLIFFGDTLQYVFPGNGTSAPPNVTSVLGYADDVAYGWYGEEPTSAPDLPGFSLPAIPLSAVAAPLAVGQTVANRRWFVVAPSSAQVVQAFSEHSP